jgi:hypothetical protein
MAQEGVPGAVFVQQVTSIESTKNGTSEAPTSNEIAASNRSAPRTLLVVLKLPPGPKLL